MLCDEGTCFPLPAGISGARGTRGTLKKKGVCGGLSRLLPTTRQFCPWSTSPGVPQGASLLPGGHYHTFCTPP
jgi:hypothetical protein